MPFCTVTRTSFCQKQIGGINLWKHDVSQESDQHDGRQILFEKHFEVFLQERQKDIFKVSQ
jgi:hypothetical protein